MARGAAKDARPAKEGADLTDGGLARTRYMRVAEVLKAEILDGRYAVGAKLPTEFDLCRRFEVSRSTVRQALAELESVGIARRRQGSGTTVVARAPAMRYSLSVSSEADILRYAAETVFDLAEFALEVSSTDSRRLRLGAPDQWRTWRGVRRAIDSDLLLGLGAVYIPTAYADAMDGLTARTHLAIFDRIATTHGLEVTSIEQQISATVLDESEADRLQTRPGSAALAVVRRYVADQHLIEVAETVHPSDRFSYGLRLDRDR